MKSKIPTEYDECILLVKYLEILKRQGKILLFTHVPQETYTKSWGVKTKNRKMGVRRGIPDYVIVTHDKVLFLEMKKTKGGTLSDEQKTWIDQVKDKQTVSSVAKGFVEAKDVLSQFLKKVSH